MKVSSDQKQLEQRLLKLYNRFLILTFIADKGIAWATTAIDPTNQDYWTHDAYIECYEAGTNN
jgi:hypothetical protein